LLIVKYSFLSFIEPNSIAIVKSFFNNHIAVWGGSRWIECLRTILTFRHLMELILIFMELLEKLGKIELLRV
jgi:hypothetical protein